MMWRRSMSDQHLNWGHDDNHGTYMVNERVELFHKIGGYATLESLADSLYQKLSSDHFLSPLVGRSEPAEEIAILKSELITLFEAPSINTNLAHDTLSFKMIANDMHHLQFLHFINHIRETLTDLNIGADSIDEIVTLVKCGWRLPG